MRLRTILSCDAIKYGVSNFVWKLFHYYNLAAAASVENVPADLPEPALKKKCEENNLSKEDLEARRDKALGRARTAREDLLDYFLDDYDRFYIEIDKDEANIQLIAVYPDGNETVVFDFMEDRANLSHKAEIAVKHYFENYMALDAEVKDVFKSVYRIPLTYTVTKTVEVEAESLDNAEDIVSDNLDAYLSDAEILHEGVLDIGTDTDW